ncbi:MAG: peptide ABC transporter substrate-binding protein [Alphaproteobacteria bacterium]|nr:peptide ABC transporter substrate-binding protein [Alphaproteobacteria bacterium]MDE2163105.1 peptide ABC transporter substrate-binding protein [Alphaproteobacteria bacterium]MDE2499975.1 peptide ABC transporter substrate-binding protein [Alphaproteobacteria bacterium]
MSDTKRSKLTRRAALAAGGLAATGALALSFGGSSSKTFTPSTEGTDTLNRGNGAEPDTLDPNKIDGNWENNIACDMFMGLMTEDAACKPIPGAAESYSVSSDGLVYTFKIRDHKWSDGTPVTAHDFVYSLRRIANPKTAAQYVPILYPIRNMQQAAEGSVSPNEIGARAIDDKTLELSFIYQVPYLMQLAMHETMMPIPAHVVEQYGDDWVQPGRMVTNGPYVLKEWIANDHIHLVKNPHFYAQDTVAIENVYYYPTQDQSAAIKRFRGGEFDLLTDSIPPQQISWLRRIMPRELRLSPYLLTQYVQFNYKQKPFDDLRVRRALSLAIDREIICQNVMRGGETAAYSLVPPYLPDYPEGPRLHFKSIPAAERAAKARWLLSEAGYGPNNPLRFDFSTSNTTEAKIVALALQEMWREVGCEVRIVPSDSQLEYDLLRKQQFSVAWVGWIADYSDAKDYLFLFQSSTRDLNYGTYVNPQYDALVEKSDYMKNPRERTAILMQAEQLLLDDVAIAPVFFGVTRNLVSLQVKGWVDNPTNFHRSRWLSLDRDAVNV